MNHRVFTRNLFGTVALSALLALATGCVTATTIGGTADPHGLFTGTAVASEVTKDKTEIASYTVVMGVVDIGYGDYAKKVKDAEAKGKKVTTKTTWYYVMTKTTAYTN